MSGSDDIDIESFRFLEPQSQNLTCSIRSQIAFASTCDTCPVIPPTSHMTQCYSKDLQSILFCEETKWISEYQSVQHIENKRSNVENKWSSVRDRKVLFATQIHFTYLYHVPIDKCTVAKGGEISVKAKVCRKYLQKFPNVREIKCPLRHKSVHLHASKCFSVRARKVSILSVHHDKYLSCRN